MKTIEIQKEVKIEQENEIIILEKGDKIRVIQESRKITKKDFISLHRSKAIGLVSGQIASKANEIFDKVRNLGEKKVGDFEPYPLSGMVNINSQLEFGTKVNIYSEEIFGREFIAVETELDSSKNPDVSWDTLDYFTVLYVKLD